MLEPDPDRATERLIERVHRGDHHAFEELIAIHRDRLKSSVESWAKFRLGPPVEIDEILHETSLRAFRSLGSFAPDGKDSFFRWLCGIAKRAMAQLRDERRGRPSTLTAPAMGDVPATSPSPSKLERRNERFDRLEAALDQLPPEYREVLLLSRIEGLSAPEIGERIGRSANAVRHLIVRALRALRAWFGDDTESLHLPDRHFGGGMKSHD